MTLRLEMFDAHDVVEKYRGDITKAAKEPFPEISDYKTYQNRAQAKIEQVRRRHATIENRIKNL